MSACYASPERGGAPGMAFGSAADAWFWAVSSLRARREGTGGAGRSVPRPCEPDDLIRCLDRLYRARQIDLRHAKVLQVWGERQVAPDMRVRGGVEARLWGEALSGLDRVLRRKGIVQ